MSQRVSDLLLEALQRLSGLQSWSSIVAENLYWASCESFLQSSLLWAINASDSALIADRERLLTGSGNKGTKPDLLLFERSHGQSWLAATDRSERLRLGCAFVYAKLAWAKGNATGSATIPAKAKALLSDIARLRDVHELALGSGLMDSKTLLIVSGCGSVKGSPDESVRASSECEGELINRIQAELATRNLGFARIHGSVWLAKGEQVHSASGSFASLLSSVLDVTVSKESS
jgi:hypothetical protein